MIDLAIDGLSWQEGFNDGLSGQADGLGLGLVLVLVLGLGLVLVLGS